MNYENSKIASCTNKGNIYYNQALYGVAIGGIAGTARDASYINGCTNNATIVWAARKHQAYVQPYIAQIAGQACTTAHVSSKCQGKVTVVEYVSQRLATGQTQYVVDGAVAYIFPKS